MDHMDPASGDKESQGCHMMPVTYSAISKQSY